MTDPQEIMERWVAGDWANEPDGGTCTAIQEAYNAGLEAAAEICDDAADANWREATTSLQLASRRIKNKMFLRCEVCGGIGHNEERHTEGV